jgi:tRNA(Ile)-lysidine synthase
VGILTYSLVSGGGELFLRVRENIREYDMIKPNDTVVAAVSGGPDSMAMLHCLIQIREELGFSIVIAHVNHGVRGKLADRDQNFVKKVAEEVGLPFHTINVNMNDYGKELGISSEEAGRILRYGFFRDILKKYGGGKVAVAHNKNDQAETLLFRVMRGTGIDGMRGMSFVVEDVIRPILNITRNEVEKYVEENSIETVEDHTNLETVYARNKIRLELIPYIEENFNPNIIDGLFRMSLTAGSDTEIIQNVVDEKFDLIVKNNEGNSIIFKGDKFLKESSGIKQRLVREALRIQRGHLHGIEEKHINSAVKLFEENKTGTKINLPGSLVAAVSYGDFIIAAYDKKKNKLPSVILQRGRNNIPEWGMDIMVETTDTIPAKYNKSTEAFIDFDLIKGDFTLRPRDDGDRFSPFGMDGTKKLKDFLIDRKVPREKRDEIPIITDENGIVWVVGYSLDNKYRVSESTKRILKITYIKR